MGFPIGEEITTTVDLGNEFTRMRDAKKVEIYRGDVIDEVGVKLPPKGDLELSFSAVEEAQTHEPICLPTSEIATDSIFLHVVRNPQTLNFGVTVSNHNGSSSMNCDWVGELDENKSYAEEIGLFVQSSSLVMCSKMSSPDDTHQVFDNCPQRVERISHEILIPEYDLEDYDSVLDDNFELDGKWGMIYNLICNDYETHLVHVGGDGASGAQEDEKPVDAESCLSIEEVKKKGDKLSWGAHVKGEEGSDSTGCSFYSGTHVITNLDVATELPINCGGTLKGINVLHCIGGGDLITCTPQKMYQNSQKSKIDFREINSVIGLVYVGRVIDVLGTLDSIRIKTTISFELAYDSAFSSMEMKTNKYAEQLLLLAQSTGQGTLRDGEDRDAFNEATTIPDQEVNKHDPEFFIGGSHFSVAPKKPLASHQFMFGPDAKFSALHSGIFSLGASSIRHRFINILHIFQDYVCGSIFFWNIILVWEYYLNQCELTIPLESDVFLWSSTKIVFVLDGILTNIKVPQNETTNWACCPRSELYTFFNCKHQKFKKTTSEINILTWISTHKCECAELVIGIRIQGRMCINFLSNGEALRKLKVSSLEGKFFYDVPEFDNPLINSIEAGIQGLSVKWFGDIGAEVTVGSVLIKNLWWLLLLLGVTCGLDMEELSLGYFKCSRNCVVKVEAYIVFDQGPLVKNLIVGGLKQQKSLGRLLKMGELIQLTFDGVESLCCRRELEIKDITRSSTTNLHSSTYHVILFYSNFSCVAKERGNIELLNYAHSTVESCEVYSYFSLSRTWTYFDQWKDIIKAKLVSANLLIPKKAIGQRYGATFIWIMLLLIICKFDLKTRIVISPLPFDPGGNKFWFSIFPSLRTRKFSWGEY